MEFKIHRENILGGLSKVQGITGKKTNLPITSNVVISSKDPHVSILATDLGIAFQGSYEAEVISEGETAVPSRKLYEILREFPDKTVVVQEMENKWIRIIGNSVKYELVGVDTEDFPAFPTVEGVNLLEINIDVMKNMIDKTIYAAVSDEGRAHLAGIYFEKISKGEKTKIRMVSTDGHRLSRIDHFVDHGEHLTLSGGVIIPKTGMVEVLKLLEGGNGLQIGFKDNNFIVRNQSEGLVIRLIEGDFPDYNLVIPKKTNTELKVDRQKFLMMLRRMSILSSNKYKGVGLRIEKEKLESTTTNPEIGESRESFSVNYEGDVFEIGFNARYVIETLNSMNSEEIIIKFSDEMNPCIIEGEDDPGFLGVIMPMRV